ncbi:fumarylacetoacetate hydrolase family protein [Leucobacter sp. BZR 635]
MSTTADTSTARSVADALYEAHLAARAIDPVIGQLGAGNVDAAYAVQELLMGRFEAAGAVRVGRKVGLTNPAVQQQLGVDQPDFGVLLESMDVSGNRAVDTSALIAPRIEAELAFVMARDVYAVDRESVMAAVESVVAAFEIVDSRVRDWQISIVDTIADNASSALYALGETRRPLAAITPAEVSMTLTRDGETVSSGTGEACLGDPITALVWVAETAARLGRPLRAGEVVLSGALGPMIPFEAGHSYEAHITGLGSVQVTAEEGAA